MSEKNKQTQPRKSNTLLHPVDELRFGSYDAADIDAALTKTEALARKRIEEMVLLDPSERTIENTLLVLCRATDEFDAVAHIAVHHQSVLGDSWNEAARLATRRSSSLGNDISLDERIYDALIDISRRIDYIRTLTPQRQKLLRETIRSYERGGIKLGEKEKAELKQIRTKLSDAATMFEQNVVAASDSTGILVIDKSQLDGLDDEFIDRCRLAARERGEKGYYVAYSEPNFSKVMSECSVRSTREDFYRAAISRAAETNHELTRDTLIWRQRLASILGYSDYAEFALEERMAKNGSTARAFIEDLKLRYRDQADQEFESLSAFARKFSRDDDLVLDASDVASGIDFFYAAKMREQNSSVSDREVKQFFALERVLEQMFECLSRLYGVRFERVTLPAWHEDVDTYSIFDSDGAHLATVWCDWYARKGKRGGAWMDAHFVAERGIDTPLQPHLGYVCANLDPPQQDKPSLLSLRDIETVWHEFGHFMHLALGDTELTEQSMMNCKWDFIEAPSQIMENWVWQPEILRAMSHHVETGQAIGDELLTRLIKDRNFMVASKANRQFALASIDLALHIDFDPEGDMSVIEYARDIKSRSLPVPVYPEDASIMTFTHIFSGGYAAGYYSYKWSEAIEADLFSRFIKEGVLNSQTGRAYRDEILARGDEVEPQVLIENFLGRSSSIEAMLVRDGLKD